ncbi:MAG: radical SAM protein [Elusimicrobiota bacterium]|jgi:radical SAM protein with 4Fe4S-binding SPASM domain|nr:radical SAM protein [Elusimicrobiota bacterium]
MVTIDKSIPISAALEITLACNMRCLHCGSSADGNNRKDVLTFEEWCKVIEDLNSIGVSAITLSGGEPFLYPKWRELLRFIHKTNPNIVNMMITNAYNITEEDVKFLKEMDVKHIGISIDGNEEIHDYIRQTKGSFKKSNEVMDWCDKYGFKYGVVTSFNKHNFPVREQILEWVLKRKPAGWQVQIVNSFGRAGEFKDSMIITHAKYKQLCDELLQWRKQYDKQVRIEAADSIGYCHPVTDALWGEDYEWQGCNAGIYVMGIEANGNVKGCLSLQDPKFTAGNVRETGLIEIWNDDSRFPYTRSYDASKMEGSCKGCESAEQCKAGCLGMAYSLHGSIYQNSYCYKSIEAAQKCGKL